MKDHEKREMVDALTKVAIEFAGAQQLRERIKQLVLPVLEDVNPTGRPHMVQVAIVGVAPMTVTVGWTRAVGHNTRLYALLDDCAESALP